jgi:hypothetical protein
VLCIHNQQSTPIAAAMTISTATAAIASIGDGGAYTKRGVRTTQAGGATRFKIYAIALAMMKAAAAARPPVSVVWSELFSGRAPVN